VRHAIKRFAYHWQIEDERPNERGRPGLVDTCTTTEQEYICGRPGCLTAECFRVDGAQLVCTGDRDIAGENPAFGDEGRPGYVSVVVQSERKNVLALTQ
jgi:hypothetical protein